MIEAFNKTLKYEFLYPRTIANGKTLEYIIKKAIYTYNHDRPQWSLKGNTPSETFNGTLIDLKKYTTTFNTQKAHRLEQNKQNTCKICL